MKERTLAVLLALCLVMGMVPVTALADEPAPVPAPVESGIYVSSTGSDTEGDGSQAKPYASLAKAADAVSATGHTTIYIMSDLTASELAYFTKGDITITSGKGGPYTIKRVQDTSESFFKTNNDPRSQYNPAMIEVSGSAQDPTYLRLENIKLSDEGNKSGKYFIQALPGQGNTNGHSHTEVVQDSMIASYNGTAVITLGKGTVLKDFGGMSAVHVTRDNDEQLGGKLIMEKGSMICDDIVKDRSKEKGDYGAAGAVWLNGAKFTMEEGSEISNVIGRAVYLDGGAAYINGTIQNITSDPQMWQGTSGSSIHIRNDNPEVTLGPGCRIGCTEDFTKKNNGSAIAITGSTGADFTMKHGAVIHNLNGVSAIAISSATDSTFVVDGEISGMKNGGNALNYQTAIDSVLTVGKNADIHDNVVWYGTIYMQTYGSTLHFYGKLHDNYSTDHCGGIMLANNFGPDNVIMYEGAEIKNNIASDTSGGVCVTTGTFTMKGGEISGNISKNQGGGVYVRRGGTFIMEGGSIIGNTSGKFGGGVAFDASSYETKISDDGSKGIFTPSATLMGGTIADNVSGTVTLNGTDHTAAVTEQKSNDLAITTTAYGHSTRYLNITDDMTIGNSDVYFETNTKTITLADDSLNIKLGNASGDSITALSSASTAKGWGTPIATFWTQRDSTADLIVGGLTTLDSRLPVYVLTQKTGADGKPADGAEVKVYAAAVEKGNVSFTLPTADVNGNGCAVAIVQPTEDFGTLTITGPEEVRERIAAEEYPVSYAVTYRVSDSMSSILDNSTGTAVYTLTLNPDTALTGTVDTGSFNGTTIQVDYTLPSAKFVAGEKLLSSALLEITVDGHTYTIPSNLAETKLTGLVTVSFDLNGGEGTIGPVQLTKGEALGSAMPSAPTRSGYTFAGWNTQTDGKGTAFTAETVVEGDLTLYAQWDRIVIDPDPTYYTLRYESNGGTVYKPEQHRAGKTVQLDKVPVREGCSFTGWYADKELTQLITSIKMNGSKTVYAGWATSSVPGMLNGEDHFAYVIGYADGTVRPTGDITRAETAAIFFRLLKEDVRERALTSGSPFTDVTEDMWCCQAIAAMAKLGVVKGRGDGIFDPEAPITRAEFAAICARFDETADHGEGTFPDIGGHWAEKEIRRAASLGWILGRDDGTFAPDQPITRAEAMTLINRVLGRIPGGEADLLRGMKTWPDNTPGAWYYLAVQEATNSHDFAPKGTANERWTKLQNSPDWTKYQ